MSKYAYMVIKEKFETPEAEEKFLNDFGARGWRFVQMDRGYYYFEKKYS